MAQFVKLNNTLININDIGYIGFFDNTSSGENSGVSIIGIHFNKEVDKKTYLAIEYLGRLEREKARGVIVKLLPVLNDLKKNNISQTVIDGLKLDRARLIQNEQPAGGNKLDFMDFMSTPPTPPPAPQNPAYVQPQPEQAPIPQQPAQAPTKPQLHGARRTLAPLMLDDYIGQEKVKTGLRISIKAAKKENRPLSHMLICSPYGLGKTTLANIIANEMEMPFFSVNATNVKDVKSLSMYFSKITESCMIFIDEIHSLKNDVQTILLSILTDYVVSYINEAGEEIKHELPPFTLIGATTQAGELLKPFLNRFTVLELVEYTDEEKRIIVKSKFEKMKYKITDEAIEDVSKRSRGVPRTIETFAKGIKDIALNEDAEIITEEITKKYFDMYDIDEYGLGTYDLSILKALAQSNKPLALITIESKTGIQKEDIAYRYEPYLIKLGFMEKTERGRVITEKGKRYIDPNATSIQEIVEEEETEIEENVPAEEIKEEQEPEKTDVTENSTEEEIKDDGEN